MSIRMGRKLIVKLNDRIYRKILDGTFGTVRMPRPTFFSDAQIKQMQQTPGSYQFKGGDERDA